MDSCTTPWDFCCDDPAELAKELVSVEIRGVNQRFLEVKLNMPREYQPWEAELRAVVQEQVARGKVDVAVVRAGAAMTKRHHPHGVEIPSILPKIE